MVFENKCNNTSSSLPRRLILARLFKANGIKFSVGAREALECGGSTPLSHSWICRLFNQ
jgi:hypothetical protein